MKMEPFKLERYFAKHEFSAPYLLCTSDCESMALEELLAMEPDADEKFKSLWLGYTESLGHPELRRAIASLYEKIISDQVLVHAGAEEAIFSFMNVALQPGDQVVVHAPYYQSLGEVARSAGAEVAEWRGEPENGWQLDIGCLKQALTDRTRVVVVNLPHNPTGYLPESGFVHELAALSDRHGFVIFADEVYRGLELNPSDRLPALADLNDRAVSLGVMSKTYGLAGLRIGWIATRTRRCSTRWPPSKITPPSATVRLASFWRPWPCGTPKPLPNATCASFGRTWIV
jgi:aspartate/methionine/tyrosine aminotransferase